MKSYSIEPFLSKCSWGT